MALIFYPSIDDLATGSVVQKLELLRDAAERYKAIVLESMIKPLESTTEPKRRMMPKEISHAYNWDDIAKLLRELRELPESNPSHRLLKADHLLKLANVYEILRGAKMPRLEAVRLALMNEANQLKSSSAA